MSEPTSRTNLLGYSKDQLEQLMVDMGERPFKGRQLFKWLYNSRQYDFAMMTDLSKDLRSRLAESFLLAPLVPEHEAVSADGTIKFLFRLHDGHPVEAVLIPDDDSERKALCISTQAGCALGCRFCATGTMGLLRDLTPGEIVGQMMCLRDRFGEAAFTNVVMMGMGEPLMNFANVVAALRIVTDSLGLGHAAKKVTISTSGVSPKIKKLADTGLKTRLAISLHAADQAKRERIMPIAQTFKLDKLFEAIRYYTDKTGFRVTLEYILFEGFNDTMEDIKVLARLIQGIPCKINLLAYNPVDGLSFKRPSDDKVDWFARQLYPRAPAVTVRKSRGQDIDAACGQLAAKHAIRRA
jgi:23S rRNA (adenine2503-C2)-methyltransferase